MLSIHNDFICFWIFSNHDITKHRINLEILDLFRDPHLSNRGLEWNPSGNLRLVPWRTWTSLKKDEILQSVYAWRMMESLQKFSILVEIRARKDNSTIRQQRCRCLPLVSITWRVGISKRSVIVLISDLILQPFAVYGKVPIEWKVAFLLVCSWPCSVNCFQKYIVCSLLKSKHYSFNIKNFSFS